MCQREGVSLQQGMNFGMGGNYSVILMSVRPNAPYRDEILDDGTILIYEGHDFPKRDPSIDPKVIDQPQYTSTGKLTQNGKFYQAAQDYKNGFRLPEKVKVYEKIKPGIWSYNGVFELVDSWIQAESNRKVFKFKLEAVEELIELGGQRIIHDDVVKRRIIPTPVKLEVWKRDGGKCVECGATDELHFDHIIPFSRGGTSLSADNIQLLCARHNISKGNKIK